MNKILAFFPLNKGIQKGAGKKLLLGLLKYLGLWIGSALIMRILGRIPLVGNLIYHLGRILDIYCPIGMITAVIQMLAVTDDTEIEYVGFDKVKGLFTNKKVLIGLAIAAVALCIIPKSIWNGAGKTNSKKENKTKQESEEKSANKEDKKEVKVEEKADDKAEDKAEAESEAEVADKADEKPEVSQDTKDFYEAAKGTYKTADGKAYTFGRVGDLYYFTGGDYVKHAWTPILYSAEKINKGSEIKAILKGDDDKDYEITLTSDSDGKRAMTISNGELVTELVDATYYSFDEILSEKKNSVHISYMRVISMDDGVTKYKENSVTGLHSSFITDYAFADVTDLCEGDELIIRGNIGILTILGIQDGYVVPLCEQIFDEHTGNIQYDAEAGKLFWYDSAGKGVSTEFNTEDFSWTEVSYGNGNNWEDELFFAKWGEDYYEKLAENEAKKLEEAMAAADKVIELDDSMVITEPLESYIGKYEKENMQLEIKSISDNTIHISLIGGNGGTAIGKRYEKMEKSGPKGVVVFALSGNARSSIENVYTGAKSFPLAIVIALKPDGSF
ncbi:MAG: hypothetical protein K6E68_00825, partial [Lachnospiraceae bacterium]|nr:hypothetical protein [Lachnospiraceae bacterium]